MQKTAPKHSVRNDIFDAAIAYRRSRGEMEMVGALEKRKASGPAEADATTLKLVYGKWISYYEQNKMYVVAAMLAKEAGEEQRARQIWFEGGMYNQQRGSNLVASAFYRRAKELQRAERNEGAAGVIKGITTTSDNERIYRSAIAQHSDKGMFQIAAMLSEDISDERGAQELYRKGMEMHANNGWFLSAGALSRRIWDFKAAETYQEIAVAEFLARGDR